MPAVNDRKETHYEVLKVSPRATVAEIVSAYHTAKNAFSKDSVATYSLFSPEEAQVELKRLEEAYLTLSNIEKRSEYDRRLAKGEGEAEVGGPTLTPVRTPSPTVAPSPQTASLDLGEPLKVEVIPAPAAIFTPTVPPSVPEATVPLSDPLPATGTAIEGATLRGLREARGLSVDDVSRITKIPAKFIKAIEGEDKVRLPARVYIQGFVKNLATLYKLDPVSASKTYLQHLEKS